MGKLTYGSLFAGVGGFDLGFDQAGWDCKFQVEWDKNCQEVLKRHWPDVVKHGDVREVNGSTLPVVDLISFGSPCQDLSVAGKRSGLEGDRSGLFFEGIRIIKEMRDATNGEYPKFAVWENVPGALTSNKGEDFAEVLYQMANIGALAIEWHVLDAQWFGVAQRRRRVFVIACFDTTTLKHCGSQILPVPEDSGGNIKKSRKKRKQASRTVEASVSEPIWYGKTGYSKYEEGGVSISASDHKRPDMNFVLEPFVKTKRAQTNEDSEHWSSNGVSPTLNGFDNTGDSRSTVLIVDGTRVSDVRIYDNEIMPTLKHRMGTGGGQVPLVGLTVDSLDTYSLHIKQDPIHDVDMSICITEQMGVGVGVPVDNELVLRRLTPLECERLMGFPDDHTRFDSNGKKIADTNRYKMCGNAIASPVAEWIGKELGKWLTITHI